MAQWLVHRSPVYYGWVVMAAGTLGLIMTSPGQSYVISIFIEYFIADLKISRSLISSMYTAATLIGSFTLPFVGRLIDRHGSRKVVPLIALAFGLACILMGNVQNAFMLGLGFVAIRFLGQGSLGLASVHAINQWWINRRGIVMGISGLFVAILGLGLFPVGINYLIPELGWRTTYLLLGLLLIGGMAPLGYLLFRDKPEQFGLLPDGLQAGNATEQQDVAIQEENWTLPEALRSSLFWVVAGSVGTLSMLTTGIVFHLVSIFSDQGQSADTAAAVFIPLSITMALVNFGGGALADRIPGRILLAISLLLMIGALLLATYISGPITILLFGTTMGAVSGLYRVIMSVLWANYFGRLHLGSIIGVAQTVAVGGSALGPLPLGIVHDLVGSYEGMLTWATVLPLIFAIATLLVKNPARHESTYAEPIDTP